MKPVYDQYKVSQDKKFLHGFEHETNLFEVATRKIKKAGLTKFPSAEKLKAKLDGLLPTRLTCIPNFGRLRRGREYNKIQNNINMLCNKIEMLAHFFTGKAEVSVVLIHILWT